MTHKEFEKFVDGLSDLDKFHLMKLMTDKNMLSKRRKIWDANYKKLSKTKEWKDNNPELEGNMRDYANIIQLVILSNLENLNAEMIEQGLEQSKRLERLNAIAKKQYLTLQGSNGIKKIEALDKRNKSLLNY